MKLTPAIIDQIRSDIEKCKKHTERNGSRALYDELVARYSVIDKTFRDGLPSRGKAAAIGTEFDFRPELSAIASKLSMMLLAEVTTEEQHFGPKQRLDALIQQGEVIGREEYHPAEGGCLISFVSGPRYDAWMSEINIFNERNLRNHPLYKSIHSAFFHRKTKLSSYDEMMGHLRALEADDDFWKENEPKDTTMGCHKRNTMEQMLADDIERCEQYLADPSDEKAGRQLYSDITSRYDRVIPQFGFGLYQYYAEQHFYDPDIGGDSLKHNLSVLMNKMIAFQAEKYPMPQEKKLQVEDKQMSNKVFIVHGHDNEAKQELARTLEKGGFEAVILHEQPDGGLTIIEKIEKYADVGYAVVLYTECDLGRDKTAEISKERYRARQNVVFEHGYLIGKLGRSRVTAIVKGNVETPGDISGVVYTPMDTAGGWKVQLAKNMRAVGLSVDMNTFCS